MSMVPPRDHQLKDHCRILVVRTDRLGDVILTLPVLTALRRRFPAAFLAMLLGRYAGAIVEGYPPLDEILWYDAGGRPVPFAAMLARLRAGAFDAVVIVHPTLRLALLAYLSRIPVRVGTGYRYYSFLFNRRVKTHRKTAERHEVEYNIDLLSPLGVTEHPARPLDVRLEIPPAAREEASKLLEASGITGKFVVIHPGSGGSAREWPIEHFGLLARAITRRTEFHVVVTGSRGEAALGEEILRAAPARAANFAGRLSLRGLAALLEKASLMIANSTGPLHVGVAVGTPVVGLYPQLPVMGARRWGPYTDRARVIVPAKPPDCDECRGKAAVRCACMASITVESVCDAAADLLPDSAFTQEASRP